MSILDASVKTRVQSFSRNREWVYSTDMPELDRRANVAVLFSGGIDSTILAFLADWYVISGRTQIRPPDPIPCSHLPPDEPIDLLNVAFENPRKLKKPLPTGRRPGRQRDNGAQLEEANTMTDYMVPDRIGGLEELEELRRVRPNRTWNFVSSY